MHFGGGSVRSGWYQVAFEREIRNDITPLGIEKPLVAAKTPRGIRIFDGICPHRGANLGYGGKVAADAIICPFHGKPIRMGHADGSKYCVTERPALTVGGLVFVCLSPEIDTGFRAALLELDKDHYFVAGFTLEVNAPAELVIENGFDATHFHPVHRVCKPPRLEIIPSSDRELRAAGEFVLPPSPWQKSAKDGDPVAVPYCATSFGPGLILSSMGGHHPYSVLTSATPVSKRKALVRLSLIVPPGPHGKAPVPASCEYLLEQSKKGLEADMVIWNHMDFDSPVHYSPEDNTVIEYRKFLNRFPSVT